MNKILALLLFSLTLCSCDPIHDAEIRNESGHDITLQLIFNKDKLGERSYSSFLNYYPGFERISPISIDTINLIGSYRIPAGKSFPLHSEIAVDPDFNLFKEILIMKPDSIIYRNEKEIISAFKQTKKRHWELVIK